MKQTLVIVTIAHSPRSDITPLLLEHLPEEQILRVSLLEGLSAEEIEEKYAPEEHERIAGDASAGWFAVHALRR